VIVQIDHASAVPIFEQLRQQFVRLIASGQLTTGDLLPPMRHLASDLDIARGTVSKVYEALVRDGYVETNGRHGTMVLAQADPTVTQGDLAAAADTVAVVATQLGLDRPAAHRALDEAFARL
jgi:DNA-binding transcriptional regulator YhcF (GntR family)